MHLPDRWSWMIILIDVNAVLVELVAHCKDVIFRYVIAHDLACCKHGINRRCRNDVNVNAVCHQGMIQVEQFVGEGQAGYEANRQDTRLTRLFDGRSPSFLCIAAIVCSVGMRCRCQLLYFIRRHTGEQIGDLRIGYGMIKIVTNRAVHIAQLCREILILIGRMDVRQILCSAAPNPRAASLRILLSLINVSTFYIWMYSLSTGDENIKSRHIPQLVFRYLMISPVTKKASILSIFSEKTSLIPPNSRILYIVFVFFVTLLCINFRCLLSQAKAYDILKSSTYWKGGNFDETPKPRNRFVL